MSRATTESPRPSVFRYQSYRAFLRAWLDWRHAHNEIKTIRWHALKIGIGSGSLNNILNGRRDLSFEMLKKLLPHMDLTPEETDYLKGLIRLDRSDRPQERKEILDELFSNPGWRRTVNIDATGMRYLSHWLLVAIREMAAHGDFNADPRWIQQRLTFPAPLEDIRSANQTLFELGLLIQDGGRVRADEVMITTAPDDDGQSIYQYHRGMLTLALEALNVVPYEHRLFAGVTLALTPAMVERFRGELFSVVQRMAQEVELAQGADPEPADIFQVSALMFPLTRRSDR